jgi:hypothetical protein
MSSHLISTQEAIFLWEVSQLTLNNLFQKIQKKTIILIYLINLKQAIDGLERPLMEIFLQILIQNILQRKIKFFKKKKITLTLAINIVIISLFRNRLQKWFYS